MPGQAGMWFSEMNANNDTLYLLTKAQRKKADLLVPDSMSKGNEKAEYKEITAMACNSAFIFIAADIWIDSEDPEKGTEHNIRIFSSRTHKEFAQEDIIKDEYTNPIKKMIATEKLLITLEDENGKSVVRFWNIDSQDFNQVFHPNNKVEGT